MPSSNHSSTFNIVAGLFLLLCCGAILFAAAGCSVGDNIGAYFNTYYNARHLFDEAEDELWNQPSLKVMGKDYLQTFALPAPTKDKFNTVIEKCSKLLQYHPASGLVDDALLMIGKAYYYQNDDRRAERKFQELIEKQPGSSLVPEAEFLLACVDYRMDLKDAAIATAKRLADRATADGDGAMAAKAYLVLGRIAIDQNNYAQARDFYEHAGDLADNSVDKCGAYLNAAVADSAIGNYQSAEGEFRNAEKAASDYMGEYRGSIGAVRMRREQGKFESCLSKLQDLRGNSNFREYFGEISLEVANVYRDMGDVENAIGQYKYVDTVYARTAVSASSYYALGLMYEKKLVLLDSACSAYNKGRTEYPAALQVTAELARRAEYLGRYAALRAEIARFEGIRSNLLAPKPDTLAQKDSVAHADSAAHAGALVHPDMLAHADTAAPAGAIAHGDTVAAAAVVRADTASRARTIPAPDSAARTGIAVRADSAAHPDMTSPEGAAKRKPPLAQVQSQRADAGAMTLDSVEARLAYDKSELAGLFYNSLGILDSAKVWCRKSLDDHPGSPSVPRVLFMLAQISAQDTTLSHLVADSLYRRIVERYPSSPFAAESRRMLGLSPVVEKSDSVAVVYHSAEELMLQGEAPAAIDTFKSIVSRYPASAYAARAQLAV